jgi:hypothetical protein
MTPTPRHEPTTPYSLFRSQAVKLKATTKGGTLILSLKELRAMHLAVRRNPFGLLPKITAIIATGEGSLFGRNIKVAKRN